MNVTVYRLKDDNKGKILEGFFKTLEEAQYHCYGNLHPIEWKLDISLPIFWQLRSVGAKVLDFPNGLSVTLWGKFFLFTAKEELIPAFEGYNFITTPIDKMGDIRELI